MYSYVKDKELISSFRRACEDIIVGLQNELRDCLTFQFKLIGSGDKRLITVNGRDNVFDLDYNLILQKVGKNLINDPETIRRLFIDALNRINSESGFKPARNRRSVITSNLTVDGYVLSLDLAIMFQGNNGNLFKIIFDKPSDRYLWNEIRDSRDLEYRFEELKRNGYLDDIRNTYLDKKNMHLSKGDMINSYSTLLETVNEIWSGVTE